MDRVCMMLSVVGYALLMIAYGLGLIMTFLGKH
jgi:hypothetical protein